MTAELDYLRTWIGRTQAECEFIAPRLAQQLAATLDYEDVPTAGSPLPPLWHWAFFPHIVSQSQVGVDGHPTRGGFLPPVPLPRRMWAGSRVRFARPLVVGSEVTRTSQILDVAAKEGRTGKLVFVRLRHELEDLEGPLISEEQDVVYREPATAYAAATGPSAPADFTWKREIVPDPVLLFRYSADTFNGHRIHYDRTYAQEQEGYPALVVHGPLTATLLIDLLRRSLPGESIASFSFKAVNPLFDCAPFFIHAARAPGSTEVKLWAANSDGVLCVDAEATLTTLA
ncbi:MaoC family dehydratase N-terminal domain-containing protein [Paraburkholderia fungorum]|jgi:3-methylfumaryl-CoA hydratase|uniref:3-methylfumaryl-CoA hydratase n=1 Tax=Paraburkholderia fungorum TaxID=134537 RepID=A0AAW3UV51_9BURK|nr:MaoC family dehydratase N-terminal domain-containing protein [Paraburkholderia fungorum]MBB4514235.1 3-methylfumaryl-CoA hydratase [Paraburkholderia fungorum]MBB6202223.1 3-methylfumaryl-CoA hydratase [Paraburkholderia fungorum]QLD50704.1 acyl-CoA dehydrogenase [Paraburkholderia fungorum]